MSLFAPNYGAAQTHINELMAEREDFLAANKAQAARIASLEAELATITEQVRPPVRRPDDKVALATGVAPERPRVRPSGRPPSRAQPEPLTRRCAFRHGHHPHSSALLTQLEVSSLIAESRARQLTDLEAANSQKDELVLKLRTSLRLLWGVNQNAQSKAREQQTLATEAADLLENLETQVAQVVGVTRLSSEVSAAGGEPKVGRTHSCGV